MTLKPIQPRFRWCFICTDDKNNDNTVTLRPRQQSRTTDPPKGNRITRTEQRLQHKVVPSPASALEVQLCGHKVLTTTTHTKERTHFLLEPTQMRSRARTTTLSSEPQPR